MTKKELVRSFFSGDQVSRRPFIPWLSSFAAKLEQVPPRQMFANPVLLSRGLRNAQELYGYDAVVAPFDSSLEAEACGCQVDYAEDGLPSVTSHPLTGDMTTEQIELSGIEMKGRLPVVWETIRQLNLTIGRTIAIAGCLTGPLTLASHLKGGDILQAWEEEPEKTGRILDFAGKLMVKICRQYCESKVDIVVVADEMLGIATPNLLRKISSPLSSVCNIVKYYDAGSIILTRGCTETSQVKAICSLGASGVVVGPFPRADACDAGKTRLGSALALSTLVGGKSEIRESVRQWLSQGSTGNSFLTTEWDVPLNTPIENMYELASVLARMQDTVQAVSVAPNGRD